MVEITKREPLPEQFQVQIDAVEGKLFTIRDAPDDVLRIAFDESKKAHAELQTAAQELIEKAQIAAQQVAVYLYELDRRSRSVLIVPN
jgi:hypothetical protein